MMKSHVVVVYHWIYCMHVLWQWFVLDGRFCSTAPDAILPNSVIVCGYGSTVAVLWLSVWGPVGAMVFCQGAFNRDNYRFPTTNYTMQVFGSHAPYSQILEKYTKRAC